MGFEAWHLWVVLGLALAVAELLGTQFVLLALGVSCLAGAAVAGFTDADLGTQILATGVLAAVLVPLAVARLGRRIRPTEGYGVTGTGAERGTVAEVLERAGDVGIKYRGDFLPARLTDGSKPVPGARVRVIALRGITVTVEPVSAADSGRKSENTTGEA